MNGAIGGIREITAELIRFSLGGTERNGRFYAQIRGRGNTEHMLAASVIRDCPVLRVTVFGRIRPERMQASRVFRMLEQLRQGEGDGRHALVWTDTSCFYTYIRRVSMHPPLTRTLLGEIFDSCTETYLRTYANLAGTGGSGGRCPANEGGK